MLYQFKIQINNIEAPPVWRRVLVPLDFSFAKLHIVIQRAFGWQNCHQFLFCPKGYGSYPHIGIVHDDASGDWGDDETEDCREILLDEIFKRKGQKFTYIYDFGDDWIHTILLEQRVMEQAAKATLLDGEGACPPEDCGGPWGYLSMLSILDNPKHKEHRNMREWFGLKRKGDNWDVHLFDLERAKALVGAV